MILSGLNVRLKSHWSCTDIPSSSVRQEVSGDFTEEVEDQRDEQEDYGEDKVEKEHMVKSVGRKKRFGDHFLTVNVAVLQF